MPEHHARRIFLKLMLRGACRRLINRAEAEELGAMRFNNPRAPWNERSA